MNAPVLFQRRRVQNPSAEKPSGLFPLALPSDEFSRSQNPVTNFSHDHLARFVPTHWQGHGRVPPAYRQSPLPFPGPEEERKEQHPRTIPRAMRDAAETTTIADFKPNSLTVIPSLLISTSPRFL